MHAPFEMTEFQLENRYCARFQAQFWLPGCFSSPPDQISGTLRCPEGQGGEEEHMSNCL